MTTKRHTPPDVEARIKKRLSHGDSLKVIVETTPGLTLSTAKRIRTKWNAERGKPDKDGK